MHAPHFDLPGPDQQVWKTCSLTPAAEECSTGRQHALHPDPPHSDSSPERCPSGCSSADEAPLRGTCPGASPALSCWGRGGALPKRGPGVLLLGGVQEGPPQSPFWGGAETMEASGSAQLATYMVCSPSWRSRA